MKTSIEVEIKPFSVPNFAVQVLPVGKKENGFNPDAGSIPLSELSSEALYNLCREFTKSVFEKAGKSMPAQPANL